MNLIKVIQTYYPYAKIVEDEMAALIWCDEFKNFDFDRTIRATRELCRTCENSFNVNIASIKRQYNDFYLEDQQRERESTLKLTEEVGCNDEVRNEYLQQIHNILRR